MLPLSGSFLFMSLVSVVTSPVQSVQLDHQIREVDGKHRYCLCTQASTGTCVVSRHVTCVQTPPSPTPFPHPTLMQCVVALKGHSMAGLDGAEQPVQSDLYERHTVFATVMVNEWSICCSYWVAASLV